MGVSSYLRLHVNLTSPILWYSRIYATTLVCCLQTFYLPESGRWLVCGWGCAWVVEQAF